MSRLVIIHDTDSDGVSSAWLLNRFISPLHDSVLLIPQRAGDDTIPDGLTTEDNVILVDRTYPLDVLILLRHLVNAVTVIDHHKSRMDEYAAEPLINSDAVSALDLSPSKIYFEYENIDVLVDTTHSACMLTHFYCMEHADNVPVTPYWFISYIEDRDMWWFKLPDSKEINAAMHYMHFEFANFDWWVDQRTNESTFVEMGRIVRLTQLNIIKSIAHGPTVLRYSDGYHLPPGSTISNRPIVNNAEYVLVPCPFTLISDMGAYMLNQVEEGYVQPDVVICYNRLSETYADGSAKYVYSIRSKGNMIWLAKLYGGGGHPNACGFTTSVPPDKIASLTINL
jgi:oligoribonuclease NrnB/cAMP/cGMP phosphodiesterase (DHH superfamily)